MRRQAMALALVTVAAFSGCTASEPGSESAAVERTLPASTFRDFEDFSPTQADGGSGQLWFTSTFGRPFAVDADLRPIEAVPAPPQAETGEPLVGVGAVAVVGSSSVWFMDPVDGGLDILRDGVWTTPSVAVAYSDHLVADGDTVLSTDGDRVTRRAAADAAETARSGALGRICAMAVRPDQVGVVVADGASTTFHRLEPASLAEIGPPLDLGVVPGDDLVCDLVATPGRFWLSVTDNPMAAAARAIGGSDVYEGGPEPVWQTLRIADDGVVRPFDGLCCRLVEGGATALVVEMTLDWKARVVELPVADGEPRPIGVVEQPPGRAYFDGSVVALDGHLYVGSTLDGSTLMARVETPIAELAPGER